MPLTNTPLQSFVGSRSVTTSGDTIHVIWYDFRNQEWEVWYRRSTDAGVTWREETRLTFDPGDSFQPAAASSGPNVYVVWHDRRLGPMSVFLKRTLDGGDSRGG